MKHIVLIGMMGCGKTTCGTLLARRLGRTLVDTDALIEQREGRTISALFAAEGEAAFRALERRTAEELARRDGLVIACGGGLPTQEAAIAALKQNGVVFWLYRDPEVIYDTAALTDRPLAQGGKADFVARFAQREPIYRRWADYIISNPKTPNDAAAAITALLESEEAL